MVESEVFVYNLGTMYYIDKLLFVEPEKHLTSTAKIETTTEYEVTTKEVELVPPEIMQQGGTSPDFLLTETEPTNSAPTNSSDISPTVVTQNYTVK